jgi:predicted DNA-binding protein (UPF0251 family)
VPRPCKRRNIGCAPLHHYFKPRGIPLGDLAEIILSIDELEALRLAHIEELYQEDAAAQMKISRQTFGNILEAAHRKVTDFLVHAKALKIEGGAVDVCTLVRKNKGE